MRVSLFCHVSSTRMRGNGLVSKKVQIRYYKTNFTERVVSHWTKLLRQVVESSSSSGTIQVIWMWHLGKWFRGDYGCVRLMIVLDDLEDLFLP